MRQVTPDKPLLLGKPDQSYWVIFQHVSLSSAGATVGEPYIQGSVSANCVIT